MRQEFTQRGAEFDALKAQAFGGFFIQAENPTARVLVKEHIFSQSRQVASPYYGSPDILTSHHIQNYPSQMVAGQSATAETMTCYYSGCYWNGWAIGSFDPGIVSTQSPPGWVPSSISAHQPGGATLHSSAFGPINQYGDEGEKFAYANIYVYDATPVITSIVPSTFTAGSPQNATINGYNFGANPDPRGSPGLSVTRLSHSPTQIQVTMSAANPGNYNVWVESRGYSGAGFQLMPGGGSQAESGTEPVTVQGVNCSILSYVPITNDPGTLPIRNPAVIRTGFAPVFQVGQRIPSNCTMQWSVLGPGTIIGSTTSNLVTVRGDTPGTVTLRLDGAGGVSDTEQVPVVNETTLPVRVMIVRDSAGQNAPITVAEVEQEIATANQIWVQAGVKYTFSSYTYIDDTTLLNPNRSGRDYLRSLVYGTGMFEVYYVSDCPDKPNLLGENTATGIVICQAGANNYLDTLAHELGHARGLNHLEFPGSLMQVEDPSPKFGCCLSVDISRDEVNQLSATSHQ